MKCFHPFRPREGFFAKCKKFFSLLAIAGLLSTSLNFPLTPVAQAADGDLDSTGGVALRDTNSNGKIDEVVITVDFAAGTANAISHATDEATTIGQFTVTDSGSSNAVTVSAITFVSGDGTDALFKLTLDESDADLSVNTSATAVDVVYDATGNNLVVTDGANPANVAAIATEVVEIDGAAPVPVAASAIDHDDDGNLELVSIQFSEPMATKILSSNDENLNFAITGTDFSDLTEGSAVSDGNKQGTSDSTDLTLVSYNFTTTTLKTTVGNLEIAYTTDSASLIEDAAGNVAASFTLNAGSTPAIQDAAASCGNHVTETGEQCDDGNTDAGDGCSATCQTEASAATCGNSTVEGGEECDDGNTTDGDGCNAICLNEVSSGANMPPIIKGVKLVNSTTVGVIFDRAMDSSTTDVTARYTIQTAASDTETISSATLQGDTVTVNVVASGATIADGDSLIINGIYNFLDDANGTPAQGNEYFNIDATKPKVIGVIKDDQASGNDYAYLRFDDRMDVTSAETVGNYTPDAGSISSAFLMFHTPDAPSWMSPDMSDKIVRLTTPDVTAISSITVSTSVTDQAGNALDDSGGINVVSLAGSASDAIAISDTGVVATMNQGSWGMNLDGCNDSTGDTGNSCDTDSSDNLRDTIIIPFTGAIDTAYLGEDSNGLIRNIGAFLEIYNAWTYSGSSASDCAGGDFFTGSECEGRQFGNLDQSYAKVIDNEASNFSANSNSIADDVLVIYLQGFTDIYDGMKINPFGIKGLNGLTATQHSTASKNQIPMPEFADVEFVQVNKAGADFADGDTVTLFFDGDMGRTDIGDTTDLGNKLKPTQMFPWSEHSWGSGGSLAITWGNHDGATCTGGGTSSDTTPDCLIITLGGSPTVAEGDEIMVMGLSSAAGMPLGFGGKIDSTAPTATATKTSSSIFVTFSEPVMDKLDDGDWSNNFGLDAGNITQVEAISEGSVGGHTGGPDMDPKKFELTVDDTSSTTQVNFTNIIDEGGIAATNAAVSTDSTAPNICKVVQNDWDGNGQLNAWDELILKFDNDGDASNGCNTDLDYSTITDPNTDFIIKRDSSNVSNPFGQGVNFWVDQWDQHAGELHINLGQGADIQPGDEIWATLDEIKDLTGNSMNEGAAQITLASSKAGKITKIVYTDNGGGGLGDADTFVVHFNTAIDPNTLGTYDGSAVTNLDWGLPIEHNFEANYGSDYTFAAKTWGGAGGAWNGTFDQLTITLAGGNAALGDGDLVQTYSIRTDSGGTIGKPGTIDLSSPVLKTVAGDPTVAGDAGTFEAGDKLIFIFSEPMTDTTVIKANLGIANGDIGDEATVQTMDPEGRVYEFTLGSTNLSVTAGSTTFDPTTSVTDINGNADNTSAPVSINTNMLPPPTSLAASDADTTSAGIDGRDLTVTWTAGAGVVNYKIYILPEFVPFDPDNHNPVAIAASDTYCNAGSCSFTGTSSIRVDSRSTDSSANIDSNNPYFPLNEWDLYNLFIIGVDDGSGITFPARLTNPFEFSIEYGSDGEAPWIEGSMPWDGAKDIPTNAGKVNIKFNEMMNRSSIETAGNIVLEKDVSGTWTSVSAYVSYDEGNFAATVEASSALDSNSDYRVRVTTSVTDAGGTALGSEFKTHFTTSATTDSTAPKVKTYFIDGATSTTNIPRNSFSISVEFNEDMDPTTFTSTSVTLSPSVTGSEVMYDPFMRGINYILGGAMESNTEYTLTLSGVYLKDKAGNTLDGNGNGTAAGSTADNYTLTFTTENAVLSNTQPTIPWIDSDSKSVLVGFSDRMDKATVEKKSNWTLTNGGTNVDLQTATFEYDGFMNELQIRGISLTTGANYTLTPTSSVLAMNGQDIDTAGSQLSFSPWSDAGVFDSSSIAGTTITGMDGQFNGDMFSKMGNDNVADDIDFKMFMPISVWPMNQTAGKTTSYHINFPTTKSIVHAGKILLKFPSSFDISSAAVATDSNSELFFFNQDINGPGGTMTAGSTFDPDGKVQISAVSANNQTKTITLTLAVDDGTGCTLDANGAFEAACTDTNTTSTTMPYDFIDFELSGIKNGDAAEIDWANDTGGYQVEITTKNNSGKTLEGPIKSMKFDIKKAGSGSISGKVTASNGTTAIQSARVFLDSPLAGHLETTTDSNGSYSFTQLPIAATTNTWDGWYNIWVDAPESSDYFGGQGFQVQLTSSSSTSTGNNVSLSSAANTVTYTITHTGDTMDGKDVSIWAGGQNGWKEKKVTLDADGSTDATIKVSNGMWDFGLMPYMEHSAFGSAGPVDQDFAPPKPIQKNISGDDTVTFALTNTSLTITGTVTDGTSGLANVNVYAYDPSGDGFGGHATTATDGSYTIKVASGTYTVGAHKPGLPSVPEKTVSVSTNVSGVNFTMVKSSSSISGSITDGTNAIQYAAVNAWTTDGQSASTMTDAQGTYSLFVNPGTWNIEARAPGYGKLEPGSEVTATNIAVGASASVTGIDFSVAQGTYYLIKGQVKDGSNNGIANVFVNADEIGYSGGSAGDFTGNGNGAKTDSSGNFSIKVKANTAGTGASATRYELHAWNPEYGDIKPDSSTPVDASSANSTGNDFTLPTKRTMTLSIINGDDLEVGSVDIAEAFVDIFSVTDDIGNHRRIKDINLTAGDNSNIGTIDVPQASGYTAVMHIPGVGAFNGTVGGNESFSISANGTIQFDLELDSGTSVLTFAGTVEDDSTNALEDAWVSAQNTTTLEVFGKASASDGTYSIKVPSGTYKLRVDKPGYKSPAAVTLSADDAARTLTMTAAGSSITGTVYKSDGSTAAAYAFVWAEEVDADGWVGTEADKDGAYTLPVPTSTNWKLFAQNDKGSSGSILASTAAGSTGKNITLSTAMAGASFISDQPKVESMTPADGGVMDDSDNTGVKINVPANALGTGDNPGQLTAKETSAIPKTSTVQPLGGIGKEITAADSSGQPITNLNNDITIELVYKKSEVENFTSSDNTATSNGLEELSTMQNAYWDATTQNWINVSTTKTVQVKNDIADDWSTVAWDTFVTNVTGEGDNSGNNGGTQKDYYDDYKVTLTSTTDHLTIFGAVTGSDTTAPSTPTGLAVSSAGNGSASLSWTANSEGDILEYQVFRGTTDSYTCNDSSQINTSAVTTTTYTDSSITSNTSYTYYYKLTAVDTSGNVSSCASAVTAGYVYSTSSSGGGGGGGGGGSRYRPATTYTTTPGTTNSNVIMGGYIVPTTPSHREVYLHQEVNLSKNNGKFSRPIKVEDVMTGQKVQFKRDTVVTDSMGKPFAGLISMPTEIKSTRAPKVMESDVKLFKAMEIGAADGQSLRFSQPVKISIPIYGASNATARRLKAFYYDPDTSSYVLIDDGGTLSSHRDSITFETDHMTLFALIDTLGDPVGSIKAGGYTPSKKVITMSPTDTKAEESKAEPEVEEEVTTVMVQTKRQIPEKLIQPVPPFEDTRGHWAAGYIDKLRERGVISGKRPGIYDPTGDLTRAELTKVAVNAFELAVPKTVDGTSFPDVETNDWYAPYIEVARENSIISGYPDGHFDPNSPITRVEALKVILESSGLVIENVSEPTGFLDVITGSWYEKYVDFADKNDMIDGFRNMTFDPEKPITRYEIARVIAKLWELME